MHESMQFYRETAASQARKLETFARRQQLVITDEPNAKVLVTIIVRSENLLISLVALAQ